MPAVQYTIVIVAELQVTGSWLDRSALSAYHYHMQCLSSLLLFAFLAVFAVSNAAQAVSANDMALDMAMMDNGATAMEDCQGCPTDGDGADDTALCQLDCTAPGAVTLTAIASFEYMTPAFRQGRPLSVTVPHGLRAPRGPFPPRRLI